MLALHRDIAASFDVQPHIHAEDFIYWYHVTNAVRFPTVGAAIHFYFENGADSSKKLAAICASLGYSEMQIKLLEFASGFGRVSRHLKQNSQLDVTACDIHPAAVEFLSSELGIKAIPSTHAPDNFSVSEKFDITFALSFFTHVPRETFGQWLRALFGTLASPGYLIFTTHGLASHKMIGEPPLSDDGFFFTPQSEQKDLNTSEYGSNIATPDFVIAEIFKHTGAPIVSYKHAYWGGHQDLWVVKRA
jgi:cyclopropane fatty-acyl-phospholipid synthase-like methyltransferase